MEQILKTGNNNREPWNNTCHTCKTCKMPQCFFGLELVWQTPKQKHLQNLTLQPQHQYKISYTLICLSTGLFQNY
jgi:hypothetical protein